MIETSAALFANGRIVDLVLLLTALEVLALSLWHMRTGRGPRPADLIAMIAGGVFLMLALRVALTDGDWRLVSLCLLGSLAAHLIDLRRRWIADQRTRNNL